MWKNGTPTEEGWYLTRRHIATTCVSYEVFWWSVDMNHWCYVEPSQVLTDVTYADASEYVEDWIEIPE